VDVYHLGYHSHDRNIIVQIGQTKKITNVRISQCAGKSVFVDPHFQLILNVFEVIKVLHINTLSEGVQGDDASTF